MQIKDVFSKPINRNIKGVITIGDDQDANIKQELEEYVVTRELETHFRKFFGAYSKSINNDTTNMGVWISGFFGSGKSHFLKILSYLLENREVDGKRAIDYFLDDSKIKDQMTINDMELATTVPNDVMLFNIDSKAKDRNKSEKEAILNVFLQVFNEQQGFTGTNFWIADMERKLLEDSPEEYEAFKSKFKEIKGTDWIEARNSFAFNLGAIKKTLIEIGYMNEEDASGLIDQVKTVYPISVESFAKMINKHIEKQADDYHMVFLVDEVGQYVGDSPNRMLNLQSIVEDLGTYTHGKAWVVVTSQQAIDEVTDNLKGQDFSKIQGRFNTRIAMSSANVDEVIKKRLLAKTEDSKTELEQVYVKDQHSINNILTFDGDVERKRYDSPETFADVYPFVPYQFNLLQDTLTAIRENGSDGKHLANGERSMLAVFQESAQLLENRELDTIVPFSIFFNGLDQFLDHTHLIVIKHAIDNDVINPNHEDNPFAVQVLETLFMVKYVSNFDATLNNVVTLMIDSINTDRTELESKVKDALRVLMNQELVEKTTHGYEFLTDAEQDISKQISRKNVDYSEISKAIGEYLTKDISRNFVYPKLNKNYTFNFDRFVDEQPIGQVNSALSIKLNTMEGDFNRDEIQLRRISSSPDQPQVIVDFPAEGQYVDDLRQALKIQKYLMDINNQPTDERSKRIIDLKSIERNTLNDKARDEIRDALKDTDIYVQGEKYEVSGKDFNKRLEDAQTLLVDEVYRNLSYIDVPEDDRSIINLFKKTDGMKLDTGENGQALQAVDDQITRMVSGHNRVSLKSILDKFTGIPFGYRDIDIKWLVAKLFIDAKIKVYVQGTVLSLSTAVEPVKLADYFTKKSYIDKVQMEPRNAIDPKVKKDFLEVADEVFNKRTFINEDDDALVDDLKDNVKNELDTVDSYLREDSYYPGQDILQTGRDLIQPLNRSRQGGLDSDAYFKYISDKKDQLLDWSDDMDEYGIREFYKSTNQKAIWKNAQGKLNIYDNSKEFFKHNEVKQIVDKISNIINSNRPQGKVQELNTLVTDFNNAFMVEFEASLHDTKGIINANRNDALEYAAKNDASDDFDDKINGIFDQLIKNAEDSNTLNDVVAIFPAAAGTRKSVMLDQIDAFVAKREADNIQRLEVKVDNKDVSEEKGTSSSVDTTKVTVKDPVPTVTPKQVKHININDLSISRSWRIQNEEDIDVKLELLKKELLKQLQNNDSVDIEL
ncbi:BREX system P-loop protein BrxC [Companilactobacillus hulinensis]|uniref:BREX system P-loop protein BrxC n=1 Tax=Companilactobacillus hulinensis TaxID=2486007 RepID=UPI000F77E294|nr:BREX system P-loop protein BrxC [Companilactobacillus hulinensis]